MKVWEVVNRLKGTDATLKQISDWTYGNKICPIIFEDGLNLDVAYHQILIEIAHKTCINTNIGDTQCGYDCLIDFLNSEVEI